MNGRRLIWRIAVAVIVFTLLLSSAGADQQHLSADPNAGWEEVGAGSASGDGISNYAGLLPSIAITHDGTPYIAWSGGDGSRTYSETYVRRWNGSDWEEIGGSASGGGISNNVGNSGEPSMAIAPDNTPYAAWDNDAGWGYDIYIRRWNGTIWEEIGTGSATGGGISNDVSYSLEPSMAIAPDGVPYVAWRDGHTRIFIRRWNGSVWEEVGIGSATGGGVDNNDGYSYSPSLAITPDGTPYVAWQDDSDGDFEIYIRRWSGSSWEEVGAGSATGGGISNNDSHSYGPSITIAPNGIPYVAWCDDTGGTSAEIYVRRWNGTTWEEVGTGSATGRGISNTGTASYTPSIAISPGGTPYVTWYNDSDGDTEIYVRQWNGTIWKEVGVGSASGGGISDNNSDSDYPTIAVAPDGIPYVTWMDYGGEGDGIYVRRYTGWEPTHRTITGNVADGHGHSLPSVFVGLLRDADVSYAMTTTTDDNGFYVFNDIPLADTYKIRVILRDGSGKTRIRWDQYGLLVNVITQPFGFATGQTAKTVHIHFTDASLDSEPIPTDVLDDLAVMFYHAQQVNNFVRNTLGESNFQPVEGIWAFSPFAFKGRAHYCPIVDPDHCPDVHWVHVHADVSRWDHPNRPMNREWHENFHHLMNVVIPWPKHVGGPSYGHRGYENPDTADSWAEGWAEFWPCVLWDTLEYLDPHLYQLRKSKIDLERNWKAWQCQSDCGWWETFLLRPREEFAVASLLWDLYDPINPADDDFIDLTISQIWDVIGAPICNDGECNNLQNMGDVYDAFVAEEVGKADSDSDGLSDLEELFIAHGFFADTYGGVSNHRYDPGEKIGYAADTGRPGRRNTPDVPNADLLINVEDADGNPVSGATLIVKVEYEPPNDYANYSYEVELVDASGNMVDLLAPPVDVPSTVKIIAVHPDGRTSEVYSTTNTKYWQKVHTSTTGYAEEATFVVKFRIYLPFITKNYP